MPIAMSTDSHSQPDHPETPGQVPPVMIGAPSSTEQVRRTLWPDLRHEVVVALAVAAGVFACTMALDWFLLRQERWRPLSMAGVSNLILSVITFVLVWRLVRYSQQQRREVMRRLEVIDEMNHHIRNALQVIAFNVRPTTRNDWEMIEMKQAVERIHWSLREILPKVEPEFAGFEGSAREKVEKTKE